MRVFLSYAHQDLEIAAALRQDLEDIGHSVWLDTTLHGGQLWWDEILRQVRACDAFVLAVSLHSLASEACVSESEYAAAVNRTFLPVRIDQVDLTSAPERFRSTQHIDYKVADAPSVKALARALNSVRASVALPEVLPPPPPTPQSYRDRYAALLGPKPLSLDDQMNYFIRLTVDIDSANSLEALELLRALYDRQDLSWKVRSAIDRFLEDRNESAAPLKPPIDADTAQDANPPDGSSEIDEPPAEIASRHHKPKWLWWAVAAAVTALVIGGAVFLLRPDKKTPFVQLPENNACDAELCGGTPIRFLLDLEGPPEDIVVTLTDPWGHNVERVDLPVQQQGGTGLEWTWVAQYEDPIGDYSVNFSGAAGSIDKAFTVDATTGAFGVVQRATQAIAGHDWEAAAAIDERIADELNEYGAEFLAEEYPEADEKHWVPLDASGESNVASTTIIGAYISYNESTERTTAQCELWTVNSDGATMRSYPLPREGIQQEVTITRHAAPGEFSDFLNQNCNEAARGS